MKKSHFFLLVIMAVCVAALMAYKAYDRTATDNHPPQIQIEDGELEVSVRDGRDAMLQGVTATDNRDGDVTDSLVVESVGSITDNGRVTVTYAAFDKSGNVAQKRRTVHYTDYVPPRFTLKEPLVYAYGSNKDIVDFIGAYDELDGDITHRVKITSLENSDISGPGIYDVLVQVNNSLGDNRELTLQVEVYPAGVYNSSLTLTDYLIYIPVGASFQPEDYLDVFRWGGNSTDLSGGISQEFDLGMAGKVDTAKPGVYSVEYTLSRGSGNANYVGYSELIVIVGE
jgi:hypothetical protein